MNFDAYENDEMQPKAFLQEYDKTKKQSNKRMN